MDDGQVFCLAEDADTILKVIDKHLLLIGASRATGAAMKSTARFFNVPDVMGSRFDYIRASCKTYPDDDGS